MRKGDFKVWDNVWGEISIEEKYLPIINCRTFKSMRDKKQLGLIAKDPEFLGGQHTRYDHSIGTFHLAKLLVKKCREKFSTYFEISKPEEEAFLLSALLHDIGHGPFSHIFERISGISHEEETFRKIETGEIHDIIVSNFGEDVAHKVLQILKDKERIKRQNEVSKKPKDVDFTFIIGELMSGAIDIDRLDYLSRDWLNVKGKKVDFTPILDWMNIDIVNDMPRIVFDYNALGMLGEYFIHRFNAYNEIYFNGSGLVLDEYFVKFLKSAFKKEEINADLTESKINCLLDDILDDNKGKYPYEVKRYAHLLSTGGDEQVLYKTFRKIEDRDIFESTLKSIIPFKDLDNSFYSTVKRNTQVYKKQKNNVFIQDNVKNQLVDISDISPIIRDDISRDTILSLVDLNLLEHFLRKDGRFDEKKIKDTLDEVKESFSAKNIESEKKFTFAEEIDYLKEFESICKELGAVEVGEVINDDTYYKDTNGLLDTFKVAVRHRTSPGENQWTVKLPAKDSTSLSKRQEYKYKPETAPEEMLKIVNGLLKNDLKPTIDKLDKQIRICTHRKKYSLEFKNSTIEMVLDRSQYEGNKDVNDVMIEAELKKGNPISLLFLTQILNERFNLVKCEESKLERAKRLALSF